VVTATRTKDTPGSSTSYGTVFAPQEVDQSPAAVLDDALRQIPGFNTFRRSSSIVTAPADDPEAQGGRSGEKVRAAPAGSGPARRGSHQRRIRRWIYWDEIQLNSIDRVEVMEGGGSDLWGNGAEGGVINIISKHPESSAASVQASYGNHNTTEDALRADNTYGPIRVTLEGDFFNTDERINRMLHLKWLVSEEITDRRSPDQHIETAELCRDRTDQKNSQRSRSKNSESTIANISGAEEAYSLPSQ